MTEAPQNAPSVAASAPEPQADQIQYLMPTPPEFAPEYDYFAVVQSLIDTAGLRESDSSYQSPFQPLDAPMKNRKDTSSDAMPMRSYGFGRLVRLPCDSPEITVEEMYREIQILRGLLIGETQGGKSILIVDNISPTSLQILGAAMNLDPTFLLRHHNEALDNPEWVSEMNKLRSRFFSLVAAAKKRRAERDTFQVSSTDEDLKLHLRYRASKSDGPENGYEISSHISCYFITANVCEYPLLIRLTIS